MMMLLSSCICHSLVDARKGCINHWCTAYSVHTKHRKLQSQCKKHRWQQAADSSKNTHTHECKQTIKWVFLLFLFHSKLSHFSSPLAHGAFQLYTLCVCEMAEFHGTARHVSPPYYSVPLVRNIVVCNLVMIPSYWFKHFCYERFWLALCLPASAFNPPHCFLLWLGWTQLLWLSTYIFFLFFSYRVDHKKQTHSPESNWKCTESAIRSVYS